MHEKQRLAFSRKTETSMREHAQEFCHKMKKRRTVRDFSSQPVPDGVIEECIRAAGTAPSGANLQPWHFSVVRGPEVKKSIREAAEREEREFYHGRAPEEWLDVLGHLGTDARKPFLEKAPVLIVVFQKSKTVDHLGRETKSYYPKESVGIAVGILIAALHHAGLATLTHTPSPMGFLNQVLDRPTDEKPFVLLVVGYPTDHCQVPDIGKKQLEEITSYH